MLTDLGWLVVHSLWQGALITGATALVLGFMRRARANTRYLVAYTGLVLIAVAPLLTILSGFHLRLLLGPRVMPAIDTVVSIPAVVWWGSMVVPIVGGAWLAGVAFSLYAIAREVRRARALRYLGLGDAGESVRAVVGELRDRLVVPRDVAVRASQMAAVPMVLGWRQPIILLPEGAAFKLRPAQVRSILAHELAHIRRGDFAANVVQMAIETLLFFHPGARWLSRHIRSEREYCCDDVAVAVGGDAADYAHALAALEDARPECRLAVAAAAGTLLDRLERVAGRPRRVLTPIRGALALVLAASLAALLLMFVAVVPPGLPFGAEIHRRTPGPGPAVGPNGPGPAPDGALPRKRTR